MRDMNFDRSDLNPSVYSDLGWDHTARLSTTKRSSMNDRDTFSSQQFHWTLVDGIFELYDRYARLVLDKSATGQTKAVVTLGSMGASTAAATS